MTAWRGVQRFQYLDHLGQWKELECDQLTFEPSGHVAFWRIVGTKRTLIKAVDREFCIQIMQMVQP